MSWRLKARDQWRPARWRAATFLLVLTGSDGAVLPDGVWRSCQLLPPFGREPQVRVLIGRNQRKPGTNEHLADGERGSAATRGVYIIMMGCCDVLLGETPCKVREETGFSALITISLRMRGSGIGIRRTRNWTARFARQDETEARFLDDPSCQCRSSSIFPLPQRSRVSRSVKPVQSLDETGAFSLP